MNFEKKVNKLKLTKDEVIKCNSIIHCAATAAGSSAVALAQLPLADAALITPIQITMITSLGAIFGVKVTEALAKSIISSLAAAFVGRGITQVLVGWIPGFGNLINTSTAAGITEALGWVAVKYFKEGEYTKYNWIKQGYSKASDEYKNKFKDQAKKFKKYYSDNEYHKERYNELLNEHEKFIEELENKLNRTEAENRLLKELIEAQQVLKNMEVIKNEFRRIEGKTKEIR